MDELDLKILRILTTLSSEQKETVRIAVQKALEGREEDPFSDLRAMMKSNS